MLYFSLSFSSVLTHIFPNHVDSRENTVTKRALISPFLGPNSLACCNKKGITALSDCGASSKPTRSSNWDHGYLIKTNGLSGHQSFKSQKAFRCSVCQLADHYQGLYEIYTVGGLTTTFIMRYYWDVLTHSIYKTPLPSPRHRD